MQNAKDVTITSKMHKKSEEQYKAPSSLISGFYFIHIQEKRSKTKKQSSYNINQIPTAVTTTSANLPKHHVLSYLLSWHHPYVPSPHL